MGFETDPGSPIPSLYGPGAVICWICTIISVLISWACNNKTRFYDTISTDLLATLSLPLIAAVHFLYEISKHHPSNEDQHNKDWIRPGVSDATFTICRIYTWVSITLVPLGAYLQSPRRTVCTGLLAVLCATITLAAMANTGFQKETKKDSQQSKIFAIAGTLVPLAVSLFTTFVIAIAWPRPAPICDWMVPKRKSVDEFLKRIAIVMFWSIGLSALGWGVTGHTKRPRGFIPETPYTLKDLDQAVALGAGILTVLISLVDAFSSRNLSEWEAFDDWRQRGHKFVEAKVLGEAEAARWKEELQSVDQRVKDMFEAEVRHNLEKVMEENAIRIKKEEREEARTTDHSIPMF